MAGTLQFHYRRRYNLPPNDPRFLDATLEEMWTDNFAWRHFENPNLIETETDDDLFEQELAALEAEDEPIPDDWEPV